MAINPRKSLAERRAERAKRSDDSLPPLVRLDRIEAELKAKSKLLVSIQGSIESLDKRLNALSADLKDSLRRCVKLDDFTGLWHHEWVSEIGKGAMPFPDPHEDKPARELWIVMHGSIVNGMTFIGPFFEVHEAAEWAQVSGSEEWTVVKLEPQG